MFYNFFFETDCNISRTAIQILSLLFKMFHLFSDDFRLDDEAGNFVSIILFESNIIQIFITFPGRIRRGIEEEMPYLKYFFNSLKRLVFFLNNGSSCAFKSWINIWTVILPPSGSWVKRVKNIAFFPLRWNPNPCGCSYQ